MSETDLNRLHNLETIINLLLRINRLSETMAQTYPLGVFDEDIEDTEIVRLMRHSPQPLRVLNLCGANSQIRSFHSLQRLRLTYLEQLSMVNMRLTGLEYLPRMSRLEILDLSDNKITGNLNKLLNCPKLNYLNLSRNRIKCIDTLEPLKQLKCLQSLDLFGNDVIFVVNYKQKVFDLLKSLRYLDGSMKETEEE